MRSMNLLVSVLLGSLAVVGVACSSDDSSPSNQTSPYDSGYHGETAEASAATPAVQIKVVGQGTVTAQVAMDGGGLNCSASATTNCTASVGTTAYATPATGWSFAYWAADGIAVSTDGGAGATTWPADSLEITSATPNPLDAVFVQQGGTTTPTPDAGAPKDAATGG